MSNVLRRHSLEEKERCERIETSDKKTRRDQLKNHKGISTPLHVSGGATMEKLKQFGSNTAFGRRDNLLNRLQSICSLPQMTEVLQQGNI
jgi:hypothetical protein